jgi:hypothetical protein
MIEQRRQLQTAAPFESDAESDRSSEVGSRSRRPAAAPGRFGSLAVSMRPLLLDHPTSLRALIAASGFRSELKSRPGGRAGSSVSC